MKTRQIILTFIALTMTCSIIAQQSFTAELSKDTIYLGNSVGLTYSLENIRGSFSPPDIDSCLISRPSQRVQTTIINGKMSSSKVYNFLIKPLHVGKVHIPAVHIDSLSTESMELVVLPDPDYPDRKSIEKLTDPHDLKQAPRNADPQEKKKKKLPPDIKVIHI